MIKVIYWSGTGNTKAMAEFIEQGIQASDKAVELKEVDTASLADVEAAEVLVLGCSSMGAEELEEFEMEPFVESLDGHVSGKKIALFGSYGWGSGEWMDTWKERMENYGAQLIVEPLIVNDMPIGEDETNCVEFGKQIAQHA